MLCWLCILSKIVNLSVHVVFGTVNSSFFFHTLCNTQCVYLFYDIKFRLSHPQKYDTFYAIYTLNALFNLPQKYQCLSLSTTRRRSNEDRSNQLKNITCKLMNRFGLSVAVATRNRSLHRRVVVNWAHTVYLDSSTVVCSVRLQ